MKRNLDDNVVVNSTTWTPMIAASGLYEVPCNIKYKHINIYTKELLHLMIGD